MSLLFEKFCQHRQWLYTAGTRQSELTRWLSRRMVDVNVHRRIKITSYNSSIHSCRLVTRVDRLRLPIGPIQGSLKQRQRKRMRKWTSNHFPPIAAIQIAAVDVGDLAISPVQSIGRIVQSQSIRPEDVRADDDPSSFNIARHTRTFNLRNFAPISPEHPTVQQRCDHFKTRAK